MKQVFIKEDNNTSVFLLFGGWGTSPELFAGYEIKHGYDFMLCYDYRDLDFDVSLLDGYDNVVPLAWSMGVWAYSYIIGKFDTDWKPCTAIGGTPFPIDDTKGIPEAVFRGTLDGMSVPVLHKFRRRMCGRELEHFMSHLPQRNIVDLKEELAAIESFVRIYGDGMKVCPGLWEKAVAGDADLIFPVANQVNAWKETGVPVVIADAAHYSSGIFQQLLLGKEVNKSNVV